MANLIKLLLMTVVIVHGYYFFKGYQDNKSLMTKVKCSQLNTYTEVEKVLFLNKTHQLGCKMEVPVE
jgi:hypothetical protein